MHPAITAGGVAVITGAASGIGRAAAERLNELGLRLVLADQDATALEALAAGLGGDALAVPTDVSDPGQCARLRERAYERFGDVSLLMNNAGRSGDGRLLGGADWRSILDVNLGGVLAGVQAFAPAMMAHSAKDGAARAIVNTGSKQGITCPPGNTAYNVSKAGIKVLTEALAHDLREADSRVTAHLLIPGFTFTGMTSADSEQPVTSKPEAAWSATQVVDFMLDAMTRGDFYILCPDNAVTRQMDNRRILWAAGDIVENRPALSRWHPDFRQAFASFAAAP